MTDDRGETRRAVDEYYRVHGFVGETPRGDEIMSDAIDTIRAEVRRLSPPTEQISDLPAREDSSATGADDAKCTAREFPNDCSAQGNCGAQGNEPSAGAVEAARALINRRELTGKGYINDLARAFDAYANQAEERIDLATSDNAYLLCKLTDAGRERDEAVKEIEFWKDAHRDECLMRSEALSERDALSETLRRVEKECEAACEDRDEWKDKAEAYWRDGVLPDGYELKPLDAPPASEGARERLISVIGSVESAVPNKRLVIPFIPDIEAVADAILLRTPESAGRGDVPSRYELTKMLVSSFNRADITVGPWATGEIVTALHKALTARQRDAGGEEGGG